MCPALFQIGLLSVSLIPVLEQINITVHCFHFFLFPCMDSSSFLPLVVSLWIMLSSSDPGSSLQQQELKPYLVSHSHLKELSDSKKAANINKMCIICF